MTEPNGKVTSFVVRIMVGLLACGELKGTPDFSGVGDFDSVNEWLVPVAIPVGELGLVRLKPQGP